MIAEFPIHTEADLWRAVASSTRGWMSRMSHPHQATFHNPSGIVTAHLGDTVHLHDDLHVTVTEGDADAHP